MQDEVRILDRGCGMVRYGSGGGGGINRQDPDPAKRATPAVFAAAVVCSVRSATLVSVLPVAVAAAPLLLAAHRSPLTRSIGLVLVLLMSLVLAIVMPVYIDQMSIVVCDATAGQRCSDAAMQRCSDAAMMAWSVFQQVQVSGFRFQS